MRMNKDIKRYYLRKQKRLEARNVIRIDHNDDVFRFYQRRARRLRMDDGEEPENGNGNSVKVTTGNTRIPYGLAKREGIDTTGMTPREVWEALEGKGYSASEVYTKLKETGKVPEKGSTDVAEAPKKPKSEFAQKSRADRKAELARRKKSYDEYRGYITNHENIISSEEDDIKTYEEARAKHQGKTTSELVEAQTTENKKANELNKQAQELYWLGIEDFIKGQKKTKEAYERMYKSKMESMGYSSVLEASKAYPLIREEAQKHRDLAHEYSYARNADTLIADARASIERARKAIDRIKSDPEGAKALEYTTMLQEHHQAIKEELGSIDNCTTAEDVGDWLSAEEIVNGECDFSVGCNTTLAKDGVKTLIGVINKYPTLKGKLGNVRVAKKGEMGSHTYADSNKSKKLVRINPDLCGDDVIRRYESDLSKGFHPANTEPSTILIHEYCHQIEYFMDTHLDTFSEGGKYARFSDFVIKKVSKKLKMKIAETQESVSKYSMQKSRDGARYKEFFAESLSEYFCSPAPRATAMEVGKLFEEYLAKIS